MKIKIHPNQDQNAIFCNSECGPTFGNDVSVMIGFGFHRQKCQYNMG